MADRLATTSDEKCPCAISWVHWRPYDTRPMQHPAADQLVELTRTHDWRGRQVSCGTLPRTHLQHRNAWCEIDGLRRQTSNQTYGPMTFLSCKPYSTRTSHHPQNWSGLQNSASCNALPVNLWCNASPPNFARRLRMSVPFLHHPDFFNQTSSFEARGLRKFYGKMPPLVKNTFLGNVVRDHVFSVM